MLGCTRCDWHPDPTVTLKPESLHPGWGCISGALAGGYSDTWTPRADRVGYTRYFGILKSGDPTHADNSEPSAVIPLSGANMRHNVTGSGR